MLGREERVEAQNMRGVERKEGRARAKIKRIFTLSQQRQTNRVGGAAAENKEYNREFGAPMW